MAVQRLIRWLLAAALLAPGTGSAQGVFRAADTFPVCPTLASTAWQCDASGCTPASEFGGAATHEGVRVSAGAARCPDGTTVLEEVRAVDEDGAVWVAERAIASSGGWRFEGTVLADGVDVGETTFPPVRIDQRRSGVSEARVGLVPERGTAGQRTAARVGALLAGERAAWYAVAEAGPSGSGGTLARVDRDGRRLRLDLLSRPGASTRRAGDRVSLLLFGDAQWRNPSGRLRGWVRSDADAREGRQRLGGVAAVADSRSDLLDVGLSAHDGPLRASIALRDDGLAAPAFDGDLRIEHRDALLRTSLTAASRVHVSRNDDERSGGVAVDADGDVSLRAGCLLFRPGARLSSSAWNASSSGGEAAARFEGLGHAELGCRIGGARLAAWSGLGSSAIDTGAAPETSPPSPWRQDEGLWRVSMLAAVGWAQSRSFGGVELVGRASEASGSVAARARIYAGGRWFSLSTGYTYFDRDVGGGLDAHVRAGADRVGWHASLAALPSGPLRAERFATSRGLPTHGPLPIRRVDDAPFGSGLRSGMWLRQGVVAVASGAHVLGFRRPEAGAFGMASVRPRGAAWALRLDVAGTPAQRASSVFIGVELGRHPLLAPRALAWRPPID